jgi:Ca-activated chloride channel homolog
VPVDDETMKKVAQLSGGQSYSASNLSELKGVYSTLQQQIGYETIRADAGTGWLRLGSLVLALAALAALLIKPAPAELAVVRRFRHHAGHALSWRA